MASSFEEVVKGLTLSPDDHLSLHKERQAIEDAISGLRALEREEARYAVKEERGIAREALENLRSLRPRIESLKPEASDS